MSLDESFDFYIVNYINNLPKNFSEYYLQSRLVSGFSSNILDEIQDLLKQIELLESAIQEIKFLVTKQTFNSKPKSNLLESFKLENEELRQLIKNNEILLNEYKNMLERDVDTQNMLESRLLEKESEINDYTEVIEGLNKRVVNYDQKLKLQNAHINQLEESVINFENNNNNLLINASRYNPIIRKFSRDTDILAAEKQEVERKLKTKDEEYINLEKKYLKLLRKYEVLSKGSQKNEIALLESNQDINLLKEEIKALRNSLKFASNKIKERDSYLEMPHSAKDFRKRKNFNFLNSPKFSNGAKTLLEEIPIPLFYSPRSSSRFKFNLEKLESVNSQVSQKNNNNGHMHQDSFGLRCKLLKNDEKAIIQNNLKEESPKFARTNIEKSFTTIRSTSTVEVDFPNPNPFPETKSGYSNEDLLQTPVNIINMNYNSDISNISKKSIDSDVERRKKLIEIEKKGKELQTQQKNSEEKFLAEREIKKNSKMKEFMKITLNMIPSGMFFTKIMDFSENLINNDR